MSDPVRRSRLPRLATIVLMVFAAAPPIAARADDTHAPHKKLTWADFKGLAPAGDAEDAEIVSGPEGTYEVKKAEKDGTKWKATLEKIDTKATMDRTRSGVKPDSKTDELLRHEQYHFDISKYWAREMEKALKAVVGVGDSAHLAVADAEQKAAAIVEEMNRKCDEMQELYDSETNHGKDAAKQAAWCTKVANLLNPPKPADNKAASTPGTSSYDPATKQLHADGFTLDSFSHAGTPWPDPWLAGAMLEFPDLVYSGYQMDGAHPLMMASPDTAGDFRIRTLGGDVALSGRLLLMMGSVPDTAYTAWIEGAAVDSALLVVSPFLQFVEQSRATGWSLFVVTLSLPVALSAATAEWWLPAALPAGVTVGTTYCDPPIPPILAHPVSRTVPPGGNTEFTVFVAAAGPYQYRWRRNHIPLVDGGTISGAHSDTLRISGCVPEDAADYEVLVFGPCGPALSDPATLTVAATGVEPAATAARLELSAPVPNPSLRSTRLDFVLPRAGDAELAIYDVGGRRLATVLRASLAAGRHSAAWDGKGPEGRRVRAGLYFARLSFGEERVARPVVRVE